MLTTYKTAFHFLRQNFVFFLSFAGCIWAAEIFVEFVDATQTAIMVAYAVVAYSFHRALLFDETSIMKAPKDPVRPMATGRFIWVFLLLFVAVIAFGFLPFAIIGLPGGGAGRDAFVGIYVIAALLANLVLLTVFGTALPAAAAADRFGFGITLRRARRTWAKILFGMLLGPGTFWLAYLACAFWINANVYAVGPSYSPQFGFDVGQAVVAFALTCCTTFATLLSIIVLCRAYEGVASEDVKSVITGAVASR